MQPPVGFSRHYHMRQMSRIRLFFPFPMLEETPFCRKKKSASLPVGQNKKVFHQRNKFPSCFAHWCFQKLFSFMSSCQVNSWCSCERDTQPASDWLCELGADVGSVTGLCQQRVLIRTDYSQLVSEEFFLFFSVFLLSCFEPFISLRARILKRCVQLFLLMLFYFLLILGPFLNRHPSHGWESPKFSFSSAD